MDKFLIRTKRTIENVSCDKDEDENPSKKKRVWKGVGRKFNSEWTLEFAVIEKNEKPLCILCQKGLNENKTDSLKKHFSRNHSEFNLKFPVGKPCRVHEIARLTSNLSDEQSVLKKFLSSSELVTLASYRGAWILARQKKPFSDGELVKEIIISTMETLLENYDSQAKSDIMQKVRNLQLSHQTVSRRIQDLSTDLEEQLRNQLKTCQAFSIALDESTDISDTAQIVFWIRFVSEDLSVHEEHSARIQ